MNKKAQMEISFSMIFSIILIIAVVGVAIYVLTFFFSLGECSTMANSFDNFRDEINKAWKSTAFQKEFEIDVIKGVESVCFGELDECDSKKYPEECEEIQLYYQNDKNVFLYPNSDSCSELSSIYVEHLKIDNFFCEKVENDKLKVQLKKSKADSLVNLCKIGETCESEESLIVDSRVCNNANRYCSTLEASKGLIYVRKCCSEYGVCCK